MFMAACSLSRTQSFARVLRIMSSGGGSYRQNNQRGRAYHSESSRSRQPQQPRPPQNDRFASGPPKHPIPFLRGLVDSHAHLNSDLLQRDVDEVMRRWRETGVEQVVHACVDPADYDNSMVRLGQTIPELYLAIGLHPLEAWRFEPVAHVEMITKACAERTSGSSKLVAIGECGLDFFKAKNYAQQEEAFRAHLHLAQAYDLPIIIHCREASARARAILKEFAPVRGVMHCWTGPPEEASWFVELGMFVSFSGVVTFPNTPAADSVRVVPDELLLIETDSPFLAPVPQRGGRNEPALVSHVAHKVAELRGTTPQFIADLTAANARRLFALPLPTPKTES